MRFSIGKLMFLVAILGVNFFLLGKINSDPRDYGVEPVFGALILLGGLPMLDVLAVLTLIRVTGRHRFDDFLLGGCLALLLYLGLASMSSESILDGTIALMKKFVPHGNWTWARIVGRMTLAVLANLIPQVAVAAVFGRLIRGWRGQDDALTMPGPQPPG